MLLRIPVPATNLWPVPTKLTPEAMVELTARAGENEDACASTRATSGDSFAPRRAAPSRTTSPERSGRRSMISMHVSAHHLSRKAVLYVRQPTPNQVLTNQ